LELVLGRLSIRIVRQRKGGFPLAFPSGSTYDEITYQTGLSAGLREGDHCAWEHDFKGARREPIINLQLFIDGGLNEI
jgi:hypothetical protein